MRLDTHIFYFHSTDEKNVDNVLYVNDKKTTLSLYDLFVVKPRVNTGFSFLQILNNNNGFTVTDKSGNDKDFFITFRDSKGEKLFLQKKYVSTIYSYKTTETEIENFVTLINSNFVMEEKKPIERKKIKLPETILSDLDGKKYNAFHLEDDERVILVQTKDESFIFETENENVIEIKSADHVILNDETGTFTTEIK